VGNKALLGSAIFVDLPSPSPPTLMSNVFAFNHALGSGTVFWLTKPPHALITSLKYGDAVNDDNTGKLDDMQMLNPYSTPTFLQYEPVGLRDISTVLDTADSSGFKVQDQLKALELLKEGRVSLLKPIEATCPHRSLEFTLFDDPDHYFEVQATTSCTFIGVGPIEVGGIEECTRNETISNIEQNFYVYSSRLLNQNGMLLTFLDSKSCPGTKILQYTSALLSAPLSENRQYTIERYCWDTYSEDNDAHCNVPALSIRGFAYAADAYGLISNSNISSPTSTSSSKSNLWFNNTAPYGVNFATQPILTRAFKARETSDTGETSRVAFPEPMNILFSDLMLGSNENPELYVVNDYTAPVSLPKIFLSDLYGQETIGLLSKLVKVTADITNSPNDTACFPRVPGRGIVNLLNTNVSTNAEGVDSFTSNIDVLCYPRQQLLINVTRQFPGYSSAISTIMQMKFRACIAGEFLKNDICVVCPDGKYSLQQDPLDWTKTNCEVCPDKASCLEGTIKSHPGYWRNSALSSELQECPSFEACKSAVLVEMNSSYAKTITAASSLSRSSPFSTWKYLTHPDSQCNSQYTGPRCSVCSRGYYKNGVSCMACSSGSVSRVTPAGWSMICFLTFATGLFLRKIWEKRRLKKKLKHENEAKANSQGKGNAFEQDVEMTTVYKGEKNDSRMSTSASSPQSEAHANRNASVSKLTDLLHRPSSLMQGISAELSYMSSKTGPALLPKIKIMLGIWQIIGGLPG
jgi:hypothetical protein